MLNTETVMPEPEDLTDVELKAAIFDALKTAILDRQLRRSEEASKEPPPARKPDWQAEAIRLRRDSPKLDIKTIACDLGLPYRTVWSYIKYIEEG